ncbi:hypothetical protein K7B10_04820 [Streptomyces flavotricini]|uniref:Uncharacterized protein n=1 Tax=Streptomyces flavotricini TaxID=66888 RepID=A0ABS8DZH6_9ACTN|nr:hypothetical protein [Streptomyces flavotricini]MCC0094123.1 hypothetical protein [Streptomyces flavotricini]
MGSTVAGGGGTRRAHGAGSPNPALGGPGVPGGDIAPNTGLPTPGSGGPGGGNPGNLYGAGGGGGSSFAAPSATDVSLLRGMNHGNGKGGSRSGPSRPAPAEPWP